MKIKEMFDKMDVYKFVVCVLAFVLIFCFIFMVQSRSIINFQNKILEKYLDQKPVITQPITQPTITNKYDNYTPAAQKEIDKYSSYDY